MTLSGQSYIANIPTEEIFTAPLKSGVNGVVYSAMPLVNDGAIIDKFHFVVKDGKIVEAHAEKGEEALRPLFRGRGRLLFRRSGPGPL